MPTNEDRHALCRKIAEHYGYQKQRIQTIQELSELLCLLSRRPDQIAKMDFNAELISEMADVAIMLEQIRIMFGINAEDLFAVIDSKLERQMNRIAEEVRPHDGV